MKRIRKHVELSVTMVGDLYGVSRVTVYRWLTDGKLQGLTLKDIIEFDRKHYGPPH